MSSKCPICERTFSQRTAYSLHYKKCSKTVESISDGEYNSSDSDEMDTQTVDNENEVMFHIRLLLAQSFINLYYFIILIGTRLVI